MNLEEETVKNLIELEKLEEMTNIQKSDYKTPVGIWVDELGSLRNVPHDTPRLKLVNNYEEDFSDLIPVSISEKPEILSGQCNLSNKDLKIMKKFIAKNCEIFLKRWNNEISTKEMFKLLDKNN